MAKIVEHDAIVRAHELYVSLGYQSAIDYVNSMIDVAVESQGYWRTVSREIEDIDTSIKHAEAAARKAEEDALLDEFGMIGRTHTSALIH